MKLTPVNGNFLVEPRLHSQVKTEQLRERVEKSGSGLLIPDIKPDNTKHDFEGIPNQGIIRFLPEGYDGELAVGTMIVFDEQNPKGFKWDGMTLFPIKRDQIVGVFADD